MQTVSRIQRCIHEMYYADHQRRQKHCIRAYRCIPQQNVHGQHIGRSHQDGDAAGQPQLLGQRVNIIQRLDRAGGNIAKQHDEPGPEQKVRVLAREPERHKIMAAHKKAHHDQVAEPSGTSHGNLEQPGQLFHFIFRVQPQAPGPKHRTDLHDHAAHDGLQTFCH